MPNVMVEERAKKGRNWRVASTQDLLRRKIVVVQFHPFRDGRGGYAHRPVLTLDNGSKLYFQTQETEVGDYGTAILVVPQGERPTETVDLRKGQR